MPRFDLSGKGLAFSSITIRVTTGVDERMAVDHAKARGLTSAYFDELVRLAITDVDGKAPVYPFTDWDRWSKKTRDAVKRLYAKVNGLAGLKDLDKALVGVVDGDGMRFDFSMLPGVDVKSITIREVTGVDEEKAIRATLDGRTEFGPTLISYSVTKIDDVERAMSGDGYDALNSRTRSLIATAYNLVNAAPDLDDIADEGDSES